MENSSVFGWMTQDHAVSCVANILDGKHWGWYVPSTRIPVCPINGLVQDGCFAEHDRQLISAGFGSCFQLSALQLTIACAMIRLAGLHSHCAEHASAQYFPTMYSCTAVPFYVTLAAQATTIRISFGLLKRHNAPALYDSFSRAPTVPESDPHGQLERHPTVHWQDCLHLLPF